MEPAQLAFQKLADLDLQSFKLGNIWAQMERVYFRLLKITISCIGLSRFSFSHWIQFNMPETNSVD